MDNGELRENSGGFAERRAQESGESIDLTSELERMERNINYYESKLQSCRDKYESVEMEICDVKQLQYKAQFQLDHTRLEELSMQERLQKIRLNYEACVEKSSGYEDPDERVHAMISELTTQRNALMQELKQLKKNAEKNGAKLAHVRAMIKEQEEKNAILLRELMKKRGDAAQDTQKRINALLEHLKTDERDNATTSDTIQ
ncbi:PREDICTED: golgin IMH1-like [Dinoponera quadriceps]|uniref:Golgin IMH1-like n=1 Tax=Dinoponera quadriceps TaxID=609295 RepID=A0A6P3Y4F0_DINQU|nr:PREDICTED: golgin IMH1-like [Dinoponera quadriceps]